MEAFQVDAHVLVGYPALNRNRCYYVIGSELSFIQDGPDSTSKGRNVTYTDKLGRIKVYFYWDRYKTTEADASC